MNPDELLDLEILEVLKKLKREQLLQDRNPFLLEEDRPFEITNIDYRSQFAIIKLLEKDGVISISDRRGGLWSVNDPDRRVKTVFLTTLNTDKYNEIYKKYERKLRKDGNPLFRIMFFVDKEERLVSVSFNEGQNIISKPTELIKKTYKMYKERRLHIKNRDEAKAFWTNKGSAIVKYGFDNLKDIFLLEEADGKYYMKIKEGICSKQHI
jgi:hypothetical protein